MELDSPTVFVDFFFFFSLADNNRLSGEIPSSIVKLTALKRLYVVVWVVGGVR